MTLVNVFRLFNDEFSEIVNLLVKTRSGKNIFSFNKYRIFAYIIN